MKILVIDDGLENQVTAKAQLCEHDTLVLGSYFEGQEVLKANPNFFDVVLVDLLMPPSDQQQGLDGRRHLDQEMPIGIFLALLAAKFGVKYIAVFTDSDHHSHPASACFDAFNASETYPTPFKVEGAKMLLSNTRGWINAFYRDDMSKVLEWEDYYKNKDESERTTVRAKNWLSILEYLISSKFKKRGK